MNPEVVPPARTNLLPTPTGWADWAAVFTQVNLWEPVVRRICLITEAASAKGIEAGFPGTCAVFIVDQRVVVKVYPPFLPEDYEREVEAYMLIGDRLDPYLPKLLARGVFGDRIDWPYLVIEFKPGQPFREVRKLMDRSHLAAIGRELGHYLRRLHDTPLTEAQALDPNPISWQALADRRRVASVIELREQTSLPKRVLGEVVDLLNSDELLRQSNLQPRLLNGDLTDDHLLVTRCHGRWRMAGLIDWADALTGPPEYEWVALWFGLCSQDPVLFRTILRAYDPSIQLDAAFRRAMMAFTCIHQFGPRMIADKQKRAGLPEIRDLAALEAWLWPSWLQ